MGTGVAGPQGRVGDGQGEEDAGVESDLEPDRDHARIDGAVPRPERTAVSYYPGPGSRDGSERSTRYLDFEESKIPTRPWLRSFL